MRSLSGILCLAALAAQALTSPFLILCRAPGPGGHERIEFAFASCCEDGCAGSRMPEGLSPSGCVHCTDERLAPPAFTQADEGAPVALPCLPSPVVREAIRILTPVRVSEAPACHGPPRYLALRALRL